MVPMPVRVNPPPGGQRRDDLAGLGGLHRHDAREGRAHDRVRQIAIGDLHIALRHLDVAALSGQLRRQRIHGGLRVVEGGLAHEVTLDEARLPVEIAPRVREVDLSLGEARLGKIELGMSRRQSRAHVAVVEPCDHLAFLDVVAFLDVELDHLARDLRCHGGLAARHDVTGGVEDGPRARGARVGDRLRLDDAHGNGRRVRPEPAARRRADRDQHGYDDPDSGGPGTGGFCAVDSQLIEERRFIVHEAGRPWMLAKPEILLRSLGRWQCA